LGVGCEQQNNNNNNNNSILPVRYMLLQVMVFKNIEIQIFHEKTKEIRNEDNLAININSKHRYGINVK
jgi:hypothetical protein